jgi:beta-glucosidase
VALEAAREAMVLLKNDGPLLPLDKSRTKSIAIIGPNAYPAVPVAGGSGRVEPFAAVSFLEGLSHAMGTTANVYYHRGLPALEEMATGTSFVTGAENGQPGLRAEYFDNLDLKGVPISTRTDLRVNIRPTARANAPEKAVAARWTGFYLPQRAGSHTFFVEASGGRGGAGYRLYVDDTLTLEKQP